MPGRPSACEATRRRAGAPPRRLPRSRAGHLGGPDGLARHRERAGGHDLDEVGALGICSRTALRPRPGRRPGGTSTRTDDHPARWARRSGRTAAGAGRADPSPIERRRRKLASVAADVAPVMPPSSMAARGRGLGVGPHRSPRRRELAAGRAGRTRLEVHVGVDQSRKHGRPPTSITNSPAGADVPAAISVMTPSRISTVSPSRARAPLPRRCAPLGRGHPRHREERHRSAARVMPGQPFARGSGGCLDPSFCLTGGRRVLSILFRCNWRRSYRRASVMRFKAGSTGAVTIGRPDETPIHEDEYWTQRLPSIPVSSTVNRSLPGRSSRAAARRRPERRCLQTH